MGWYIVTWICISIYPNLYQLITWAITIFEPTYIYMFMIVYYFVLSFGGECAFFVRTAILPNVRHVSWFCNVLQWFFCLEKLKKSISNRRHFPTKGDLFFRPWLHCTFATHVFFWHHRHCLVKEIRLPRKWHRFVPIWEKAYTFDSRKISSRYTGEIPLQYVFFLHQVTTSQLECIPKVLSPNASQRKDWKSLENTGPFCANDWIIHTHGPLGFFGGNC